MLDSLVLNGRGLSSNIITGDYNALALYWGSRVMNTMSQILLESFAEVDIVLAKI